MPHVNGGGGGDDLASSDEMTVYKHEGEEREETKGSENLTEEKSDLIIQSEEEKCLPQISTESYASPKNAPSRTEAGAVGGGKSVDSLGHDRSSLNMGYIVTPYPYPNGTAGPIPVSMANKVGMVPPTHPNSPLSFVMYNETFGQPPPAHMGIPTVHIDPKTGIPRHPMYPLPSPGQYSHSVFTPEFAQWHTPSMYPITSATGYRGPYPTSLVTTAGIPRFNPAGLISAHPGLPPHPAISHPAIVTPGPKQDIGAASVAQENHLSYYFLPPLSSANGMLYNPSYHGNQLPSNPSTPSPDLMYQLSLDLRSMKHAQQNHESRHSGIVDLKGLGNNSNDSKSSEGNSNSHDSKKKAMHIKKPLNAFMLYMKEMRAKVVAECTLKESAAINQILGRRWHALGREEQAKYYELARKERQLHMQLYPGWSARDNYAQQGKKKKRKRDKSADGEGNNPKKCRARFGLDQQSSWCKPCRRKKKCIRYIDGSDSASIDIDDNLGSVGSSGDLGTPDSKSIVDSDQEPHTSSEISLSSPPVPVESLDNKTSLCPAIGSNPHDANNPLSVSSLTGQHKLPNIKRDPDAVEGNSLSATVTSRKTDNIVMSATTPIASVT